MVPLPRQAASGLRSWSKCLRYHHHRETYIEVNLVQDLENPVNVKGTLSRDWIGPCIVVKDGLSKHMCRVDSQNF